MKEAAAIWLCRVGVAFDTHNALNIKQSCDFIFHTFKI